MGDLDEFDLDIRLNQVAFKQDTQFTGTCGNSCGCPPPWTAAGSTCQPTCPDTCLNTCPTCDYTCSYTCDTCYGTCDTCGPGCP